MRKFIVVLFLLAVVRSLAQPTGLIVQAGHTGNINSVCYSPDGRFLLTAGEDGARLWEARSGRLLHYLKGHNGTVETAVFSYDGSYVITGGSDSAAAVWDTESGTKKYTFKNFNFWPGLILASPVDKRAFISEGNTGLLVDLSNGEIIKRIDRYSYITNVVFNPEGTVLITEGWGYDSTGNHFSSIDTWSVSSGTLQSTHYNTGDSDISDIRFSSNGVIAWLKTGEGYKLTVYSGLPGSFKLETVSKTINDAPDNFNLSPGGKTAVNVPYTDEGCFMAFAISDSVSIYKREVPGILQAVINPAGDIIYTLDSDTGLKLWEAKSGRSIKTIPFTADITTRMALSPDGNYLAVTNESSVFIIGVKSGRTVFKIEEGQSYALTAVFDSLSGKLYSAQSDNIIRGWDIKNAAQHIRLVDEDARINSVTISPEGSEIAFTDNGGYLGVQHTNTGEEYYFKVPETCYRYRSVAFHPARRKLLAAACGQLEVIDLDSFPLYFSLNSPFLEDQFAKAGFSPSGNDIAALNTIGDIFIWKSPGKHNDTARPDHIPYYLYRPYNFNYVADGKSLLLVCKDGVVRLVSAVDYSLQKEFGGFTGRLYRAETNTQATLLLVGDGDSVKKLRFPSGEKVYSIYTGGRLLATDWVNNKMAVERDERLLVYDIATGEGLYSIIAFEKDEYLFLLPDGKYKATKNAASHVGWLKGLKRYDFDQFDLLNNRPDLVLKALGNTDTLLQEAYYKAWNKRVKRAGFTPESLYSSLHVPEVILTSTDNLPLETNNREITVGLSAMDSLYLLRQLNVWINGVPLYGYKGKAISGKTYNSPVKIPLSEGRNKIQFSVTNEKGAESFRPALNIVYSPVKPAQPRTWFIGFGVNNYEDKRYTLNYSVKDIQDLAGWFSKFPGTVIDTFTDARVTRENILAIKKKLLKTEPEDRVILSFSGHGMLDDSLNFYYATRDIDFKNPGAKGVLYEEIERLLDSIPARKKLLLMDACHSGESDLESITPQEHIETGGQADSGQLMITRFGSRGMELLEDTSTTGLGLQNSFELMQELFADVSRGTGARIISAAAGDSYAYEKNDLENGVFTWCVLNGLKNKAADYNSDGKITVVELEKYVKSTVEEITKGKQKPTSRSGLVEYDWEL